jgi:hypothetical protein
VTQSSVVSAVYWVDVIGLPVFMLGTRISCRIASYQRFFLTSISRSARNHSILSNRAPSDNPETVHSMDKTAEKAQQPPRETVEPASEGAPETFEVFQPRDMKSNSEAGKCNPLIDPHCAHDDKLPAMTGSRGYRADDD